METRDNTLQQRIDDLERELTQTKEQLQQETTWRTYLENRLKRTGTQRDTVSADDPNLLHTLIDTLPDYVYIKDREGRLVICNAAYLRFMQVETFEPVAFKTDFDFFPHELAQGFFAEEQQLMDEGKTVLGREEAVTDAGGVNHWISTSKIPLRNTHGAVIGVVGISSDVTTRKQAEIDREQFQQYVIQAQKQMIKDLSTPIIPLIDRMVIVPLIGRLTRERSGELIRRLLAGIGQHRAKIVIMDMTGMPDVDEDAVAALARTIQSARLKGAKTILCGIPDSVVEIMVDMELDWHTVETISNLQTAMITGLQRLGIRLTT